MDLTTQGSTSADAGSTAKAVHTYLLTPGNGTVEIDIACEAPKLKTLMFSPEHQALVALDQGDCEIIDTEAADLDALVEALNDAQQQKQRAQEEGRGINRAKIAVRAAKAALKDRLEALSSGSGAGANTWYELHSMETAGQVRFVPGNILDAADRSRFFRLVEEPDAENAFNSFRDADGNIDASKFKKAFTETSASIKAEWQLVDETGQVPTRVLANAVSPVIANLLNDELEALDGVIAEWNKTLNWQTRQYQSQHERALTLLKEDPISHEDFGRAKVLCEAIWRSESPISRRSFAEVQGSLAANRMRQAIIEQVQNKPLPPASWTASAEANLMRYSKGVTLSANFDPLKGVLAGEAKAEFEFALAEARLEGSVYYPHEEGLPVGPRVRVKTRSHRWAVFDRCLPDNVHFKSGSEFMHVHEVGELVSAFGHWGLLKRTLDDQYKLMILGHTDLVGENDYNQALSLRRAQVAYGLLTRNPTPWARMFELGYWGETERQYMIEHSSGQESDPPHELIQRYFEGCENRFTWRGTHLLPHLTDQAFAMTYLIPRGELEPVINVETQERMNRRVEFVVLETVDETVEMVDRKLDLGHMRAKFEGQVSGFAGVNLSLAAEVSVDVSGGELTLANKDDVQGSRAQASTSGGGAQAEAFIGAKIEAGLAAELDWKQPQDDEQSQQGEGQDFLALGTVGYLVSGHVGLALNGKFKVGFDREIKRFVIKLEASLCLGPGVGGKFEATVDAKQVWNFISLVHHQLLSQDFNWVDMFEDGVYDRFVAWSYELINKGYWFPGLQLRAGVEIAHQAVGLLNLSEEAVYRFRQYEEASESLYDLIAHLSDHSVELNFAPPEVKGRILYRLIDDPRHYRRDWSFGFGVDIDQPRERAVLHLLKQGVSTRGEYLEVLEHTLGESKSGRSLSQRCQDATNAQQALLKYMNDAEDRRELAAWWDSLPDVSSCTCSIDDLSINPFNR